MALAIKQMTDDVHKALGQFELRLAALEKMVENVGEAVEQSTMGTACPWAWVTEHQSCAAATVEDILVGKVEEWVIRECLRCARLVPALGAVKGALAKECIAGELLDLAAYHERLLDTWTHRFLDEANRQAPTPDLLARQRRALEEPELNLLSLSRLR